MTTTTDPEPTPVPATANPVGQALDPWWWTEPSVWKERLLTALEQGIKGGVWYSLIDKVYREGNLASAFAKVLANRGASGVDHVTVQEYDRQREANLRDLRERLRAHTYPPPPTRGDQIPKPGSTEKRPLGHPTVRDPMVQGRLRAAL